MEIPAADMLFEVSWEVCNKVGGIYTVVKSKTELMTERYRDYCLVGPYFRDKAVIEIQEEPAPQAYSGAIERLHRGGISCIFGKWIAKGSPKVLLVDFSGVLPKKNEIKKWLWENYQIDTLFCGWDYEEPMVWAYSVARLLEEIAADSPGKKVVAHFHEWLAGIALLHTAKTAPQIKTVFTTHATMLGRSIAGNGQDLYSILDSMEPDAKARELGVVDKFTTERACAQECHVFTTVSEITAIEAETILGRKAQVLLLNGLDIQKFPNFEECSLKHAQYRDEIRDFLSYYFLPYYHIDMEQTLQMFIVGRYEFRNKGIDIFIKALGRLNARLRSENADKAVIVFFWIPSEASGIRSRLVDSSEEHEQVRGFVDRNLPAIRRRLINSIITDRELREGDLYDEDFKQEARRLYIRFQKEGRPPLSTHYLPSEDSDAIQKGFREAGLLNRAEDPVKVIHYPVYLDGNDQLLNLKYYEALQGCHFGVFPSYYEPYGYTPLESAALGVPSLTTDLAGFGRFIKTKINAQEGNHRGGIFILDRHNRDEESVINDFTDILHSFAKLHRKDRVLQKMLAKELAEHADWKILINNYVRAHNMALEK